MKETLIQIDQAGRVVLPKQLRERFRLRGGDTLAVEVKGDVIELRTAQAFGHLERVNGVFVFTAPGTFTHEDLVEQSREERIDALIRSASGER